MSTAVTLLATFVSVWWTLRETKTVTIVVVFASVFALLAMPFLTTLFFRNPVSSKTVAPRKPKEY